MPSPNMYIDIYIYICKYLNIYIYIDTYIGSMCWNGKIPSRTGIKHHIPCPHARSQKLSWKKKKQCGSPSLSTESTWLGYTNLPHVYSWIAGPVWYFSLFLISSRKKSHLFHHRWFSNAPWAPSRCSTKFQSSIDFVWHFRCHTGKTVKSVTLGYMDIFRNLGVPSCSNVQVLFNGLAP